MAWVAGGLLIVGTVSVFALRPARMTSARTREDSVQGAERDSALRLPARYRQDTAAYASYLRGLALRFSGTANRVARHLRGLGQPESAVCPGTRRARARLRPRHGLR